MSILYQNFPKAIQNVIQKAKFLRRDVSNRFFLKRVELRFFLLLLLLILFSGIGLLFFLNWRLSPKNFILLDVSNAAINHKEQANFLKENLGKDLWGNRNPKNLSIKISTSQISKRIKLQSRKNLSIKQKVFLKTASSNSSSVKKKIFKRANKIIRGNKAIKNKHSNYNSKIVIGPNKPIQEYSLETLLLLAEEARRIGDVQRAFHYYSLFLEKNFDPKVANNYGALLILQGRLEEAVTILKKAYRATKDRDPALAFNLSLALVQTGARKEACAILVQEPKDASWLPRWQALRKNLRCPAPK